MLVLSIEITSAVLKKFFQYSYMEASSCNIYLEYNNNWRSSTYCMGIKVTLQYLWIFMQREGYGLLLLALLQLYYHPHYHAPYHHTITASFSSSITITCSTSDPPLHVYKVGLCGCMSWPRKWEVT